MARDFNQFRNANAILKSKSINSPSVNYAVNDGADGYNLVEVSSLPTVELFIGQGTQAHEDITEWTLFNSQSNYGGIGENAFGRFPNLKEITIWQEPTDSVMNIDDDAFSNNVELDTIYVHPDKLSAYQTKYAGKSFVSFFTSYALVTDLLIPSSYNGETAPTTLTKEWVDKIVANMPLIERNAKTTVIVPNYFTVVDIGAFSGLGSLFSNITELKCNGVKSFNAGFLNGASWCIHLWLDNGSDIFNGAYVTDNTTLNANFRTLAPYLVFANYFMSEYPSAYPVVGYNQFTSGDTLPQTSPTGEYLWFSNINFDTDYESPTGLENDPSFVDDYEASSSGYYYCYDKTTTLVIQGSGTLTSALVESAINGLDTPLSWITEIIIPNTFSSLGTAIIDSYQTLLTLSNLEEGYWGSKKILFKDNNKLYQQYDYIKSSSTSTNIVTGIKYNQNMILKIGFTIENVNGMSWTSPLGNQANWSSNLTLNQYSSGQSVKVSLMNYACESGTIGVSAKKDIEIKSYPTTIGTTDEGYVKVDGTTVFTYDHTSQPYSQYKNFSNENIDFKPSGMDCRVYYLQIIDANDDYLFNGVSACDLSNGNIGLYDYVSKELKYGSNYVAYYD